MVDPRVRVDVRLRRAIESGAMAKEVLVCGPAGTGKTYGILAVLHAIARRYPNLRVLLLRQTRVSLSESVLVTLEQDVLWPDGMGAVAAGASRRNRAVYRYPNGTELVCGGLDKPGRIFSTSWDIIYVNESVELEEDAWLTVGSRLNRPGRPGCLGLAHRRHEPRRPVALAQGAVRTGGNRAVGDRPPGEPRDARRPGLDGGGRLYLEQLDRLRGTLHKRLKLGLWRPAPASGSTRSGRRT